MYDASLYVVDIYKKKLKGYISTDSDAKQYRVDNFFL